MVALQEPESRVSLLSYTAFASCVLALNHGRMTDLLKYQSTSSPDTTWLPSTRDSVGPVLARRSVEPGCAGPRLPAVRGSERGVGACGDGGGRRPTAGAGAGAGVGAGAGAGVCSGRTEKVARGLGGVHAVCPLALGLTTCLMLWSSCSSCSSLLWWMAV